MQLSIAVVFPIRRLSMTLEYCVVLPSEGIYLLLLFPSVMFPAYGCFRLSFHMTHSYLSAVENIPTPSTRGESCAGAGSRRLTSVVSVTSLPRCGVGRGRSRGRSLSPDPITPMQAAVGITPGSLHRKSPDGWRGVSSGAARCQPGLVLRCQPGTASSWARVSPERCLHRLVS